MGIVTGKNFCIWILYVYSVYIIYILNIIIHVCRSKYLFMYLTVYPSLSLSFSWVNTQPRQEYKDVTTAIYTSNCSRGQSCGTTVLFY